MAEIVIQDCGCIAIPEQIAASLGMLPGVSLQLEVDSPSRSIKLSAPNATATGHAPAFAACPIK